MVRPIEYFFMAMAGLLPAGCYMSSGLSGDVAAREDAVENDREPTEPAVDPDEEETREVVDVPLDDAMEDSSVECTPHQSAPRQILGMEAASGSGEHPEVVALTDGSFYVLGRKIVPTTEMPDELTMVNVTTMGTEGGEPFDLFGASSLPGYHPLLALGNDMGILFKAPPELPDDNIVYIHVSSATTPPTTSINAISVTDADSFDPCGVDNGRNLFVAWRQACPEGNRIEGAFLEYDGAASPAGVISGEIPGGIREPAVAFGGERYLVVYFYYRDSPGGSDLLYLVELDADAVPVDEHSIFLSGATSLAVGRPAVVWAGDRWAVFWEEFQESAGNRSRLHLTTKFAGGSPMDDDISAQWSSSVPSITGYQPGELDMVWTGDELGLVMTYDAGEAGRKIYFGEFDLSGRVLGDIVPVSVIATAMFNPSLTFMRSVTERYYLFAWLQLFSSGLFYVCVLTYGCSL